MPWQQVTKEGPPTIVEGFPQLIVGEDGFAENRILHQSIAFGKPEICNFMLWKFVLY